MKKLGDKVIGGGFANNNERVLVGHKLIFNQQVRYDTTIAPELLMQCGSLVGLSKTIEFRGVDISVMERIASAFNVKEKPCIVEWYEVL